MENLDLNVLILHNFLNNNHFLIEGNKMETEMRVAVRELEIVSSYFLKRDCLTRKRRREYHQQTALLASNNLIGNR